jgi:hypothetical protein
LSANELCAVRILCQYEHINNKTLASLIPCATSTAWQYTYKLISQELAVTDERAEYDQARPTKYYRLAPGVERQDVLAALTLIEAPEASSIDSFTNIPPRERIYNLETLKELIAERSLLNKTRKEIFWRVSLALDGMTSRQVKQQTNLSIQCCRHHLKGG